VFLTHNVLNRPRVKNSENEWLCRSRRPQWVVRSRPSGIRVESYNSDTFQSPFNTVSVHSGKLDNASISIIRVAKDHNRVEILARGFAPLYSIAIDLTIWVEQTSFGVSSYSPESSHNRYNALAFENHLATNSVSSTVSFSRSGSTSCGRNRNGEDYQLGRSTRKVLRQKRIDASISVPGSKFVDASYTRTSSIPTAHSTKVARYCE